MSEGALTFQSEQASACFNEVKPLLEAHWHEVAAFSDIPLDPDWELYQKAEDAGMLRAFSVRDEGRLVGYAVFFVKGNAHYKGSLQAVQDIVYLDPKYRLLFLGLQFLGWCDQQLKASGVQCVYHHVKTKLDFGLVLKRLGYEHVEAVWVRRLDRET